jgi:lipopolysaccharide transport system ATP-binding protein
MKPIIEVKNLSKKYALGQQEPYYALRDALDNLFRDPFKAVKKKSKPDEFWALKNVSFDIEQGDVVGIIGRNGAGKSTILKILSQITLPSEGEIILRGRVGSLLEVGTGFHPELTGRENIFLNGAILGMKKSEVKRKFDEIVDFAEVETFLDTPLKRYSSGMYMRLAFSVAAHLEPEILIVDEVLAVGDAEFQKKCMGKMSDVAQAGRTVLFVSHNMSAIQNLCNKGIYLEKGRLTAKGEVNDLVNLYLKNKSEIVSISHKKPYHLSPNVELRKFEFSPNPAGNNKEVEYEIVLWSNKSLVIDAIGILLFSSLSVKTALIDIRNSERFRLKSNQELVIRGKTEFPFVEGDYSATMYIKYDGGREEHHFDLAVLSIFNTTSAKGIVPYTPAARGVVELQNKFKATYKSGKP